jgi:ABC-type antimicrobial peptide transport system permease subunit
MRCQRWERTQTAVQIFPCPQALSGRLGQAIAKHLRLVARPGADEDAQLTTARQRAPQREKKGVKIRENGVLWWARLAVGTEGVTIALNPSVLLGLRGLAVSALVGVAASLVPAWQAARAEIVMALRQA